MPFLHCHEKKKHYQSSKYVKVKERNGYDIQQIKENLQYEGSWKNSQRDGFGLLVKKHADKFKELKHQGDWRNNVRDGTGNGYVRCPY